MAVSNDARYIAEPAATALDIVPGVFLDKDGTVLEDEPYNVDPKKMRFESGAERGVRLLAALGCPLVVVSNQPGVAEGRFAEHALADVFEGLHQMFAACGATLSGFVYCPHQRPAQHEPGCSCRKPEPGLLLAAAARLRIDLDRSWMIGDILDDIEAGRRAGCRTVLIDNGHETEWREGPQRRPDLVAADLGEAAHAIRIRWQTEALE